MGGAMKQCSKCHKWLPVSDFHKRSDRPIGLRPDCRWCQRMRWKQYQPASGKYRPRSRRYDTNPEKKRAHQQLRDAVRHGHIQKPSACEECRCNVEKAKLCGHHFQGYESPLTVKWLCHSCHALAHMVGHES